MSHDETCEWKIRYETLKSSAKKQGRVVECETCPCNFYCDTDYSGKGEEYDLCTDCENLFCLDCSKTEMFALKIDPAPKVSMNSQFKISFSGAASFYALIRCRSCLLEGDCHICRLCDKEAALQEESNMQDKDVGNWDGGFDLLGRACLQPFVLKIVLGLRRSLPSVLIELILQHLLILQNQQRVVES